MGDREASQPEGAADAGGGDQDVALRHEGGLHDRGTRYRFPSGRSSSGGWTRGDQLESRLASGTDRTLVFMTDREPDGGEITALLHAHAAGDAAALERLLPHVYDELRRIARYRLRRERPGHTLAATELVHEAFLKLVPVERVDWRGRAHFFAIASRAMRNVLIDHAVRRGAVKRGAGAPVRPIEEADATTEQPLDDLITLSQALSRLEQLDARQAQVVECRFFGGLSLDETAEALNTSAATVSRDWTFARAWLHNEIATASSSRGASPSTG